MSFALASLGAKAFSTYQGRFAELAATSVSGFRSLARCAVSALFAGLLVFAPGSPLMAAPGAAPSGGTDVAADSIEASGRSTPVFGSSYSADVLLREKGHKPKKCGSVRVEDGKARLDVDLGVPGVFRALLQPEKKSLLVLAESLKGYVDIPIHGDESDMRALAARVADSVMPFGVPVLAIREENRKELGSAVWQGIDVQKSRSRLAAEFMGNRTELDVEVWEHTDFAPFPLRIINLGGSSGEQGDSVELTNIVRGAALKPDKSVFALPAGYSRYSSVMDLLLYALAAPSR